MNFKLTLTREKEFNISILQSKILISSLLVIIFTLAIYLAVKVNIITLLPNQLLILESIFTSLLVILISTILLRVSTPIIDRLFHYMDYDSRSYILRVWTYGVWVIASFVVFAQFTGNMESIGISIGVFSAGLAIALQQPITSILGWFIILGKRTYTIGDRIVVKGIKGDVLDITLFYTVLQEVGGEIGGDDPTGVKITMPNNIILTEPIHNQTTDYPYVWDHVKVAVTYESDIAYARQIIKESAQKVVGEVMEKAVERMKPYLYRTPQENDLSKEPVVFSEFADSSTIIRVKYLCRFNNRHRIRSRITEEILIRFNQPENVDRVKIAYPHTELVFHDQSVTGAVRKSIERD